VRFTAPKDNAAMTSPDHKLPETSEKFTGNLSRCWIRWCLLAFGWANVGLGLVGIFIPGLPTTIFLIIAFWAFSKSSEKFQNWLWSHPILGTPIHAWHMHRVIPVRAKIFAAVMMTFSFVYVAIFIAEDWVLPMVLAGIMTPAATYVLTRASAPPHITASDTATRKEGPC
tara:strand:+ start:1315 stop:1824 length:510 start_codon:yes stop_codon:yes gene_type:complete